ncbi:HAMP domain-containing histidine kinase [Pseudidiomarina tainanensis]|uniref:HAMP domain-containing histidine kinase n=1 Tax=Pseudidiomarina tainanensis TaxID=502365 RepID=A0ACD2HIK4_9GAMM|nr:HAMP domain-containing histidine kinase [Pseudidiomarina tainanensis]
MATMTFKVSSIKRSVTSLVILITTISVALACIVLSFNFILDTHQRLLRQTDEVASFIAGNANAFMVYNQADSAERWLRSFQSSPLIKHIHLYRHDPDSDSLSFFASYYAEQEASIPVRFERARTLTQARFTDTYVETARPLMVEDSLQGYVYIRTSREDYDQAQLFSLAISAAITTASLILSWLMSLWLRRIITQPLDEMVESIQDIARDKKYGTALHEFELQELDRVAIAFNSLLSRIQQHIKRQEQAERQASDLNAELELQVKQRTQMLFESNQELQQALATAHQYQNELVQAEKMQSLAKLVSGVAHEVNTPVGLAVTSTSILQDNLVSMKQKFAEKKLTSQEFQRYMTSFDENLALISRNIRRTADLISNFSKLSMDQFSDEDRPVQIAKFWDDIEQSLRSRHPELAQIQLSAEFPEDLTVNVRPGPLNQVINQLVQNALQHAFAHTVKPSIKFEFRYHALEDDAERGELELNYYDNGDGIPNELLKVVFDPFVTTKRSHGAAGLGLHLVYNLVVHALQGQISLASPSQRGTEFHISVPVRQVAPSK